MNKKTGMFRFAQEQHYSLFRNSNKLLFCPALSNNSANTIRKMYMKDRPVNTKSRRGRWKAIFAIIFHPCPVKHQRTDVRIHPGTCC